MSEWPAEFAFTCLRTVRDVLPIAATIVGFQILVIRRPLVHPKKILIGFLLVLVGIALFLQGLKMALFPLGKMMAEQLTDPAVMGIRGDVVDWKAYIWVYGFAASLGFATTLAEPALIAVAVKAQEISGDAINAWRLRLAVAFGVGFGIALGTFRIVTGAELYFYIIAGYLVVMVQTAFAPRAIIGLAYDSGGVATSTVTVPLVTALGVGLASSVPGRSPLVDGFGLIAFACLFPVISVMAYAQLAEWRAKRTKQC